MTETERQQAANTIPERKQRKMITKSTIAPYLGKFLKGLRKNGAVFHL